MTIIIIIIFANQPLHGLGCGLILSSFFFLLDYSLVLGCLSLVAQRQRICLPKQETQLWSLGQKDILEKEMATQSSILAWDVPRTEEPGELQLMELQRVGHDLTTKQQT